MRESERNLDNVIFKAFEVADKEVKVRTYLDEDVAQIRIDGKIVAEYKFGGAGSTFVYHADTKALIDIIAEIAHSGIDKMRG